MMTFSECLAACAEIVPSEPLCLQVEAWSRLENAERPNWRLWVASMGRHITARTPDALVEAVRVAFSSTAPRSMTVGEVAI
jgi:hypothetical protein